MSTSDHARFMATALQEARRGLGLTSPNPAVGAVLALQNRVVAYGYHRGAGFAHAEVDCLEKVKGALPRNATLYVTLEPCSTRGRTAPCVDYIMARGVRRIVIGAIDPNPRHAGRAIGLLRESGVKVTTGILQKECQQLNEGFNKWITSGMPFVLVKCAMTLDGRLTRPPEEPRWITSAAARAHAGRLRGEVDAVLVGAETVRQDNPRLTIRRGTGEMRQPWRVILTRTKRFPRRTRVLTGAGADRTLLLQGRSFRAVLQDLGRKEITSVLVEGGGTILSAALEERLIDKVQIYFAPLFTSAKVLAFAGKGVGSTAEALRLRDVSYERVGSDVCLTGYTSPP
ncbi:MAG: bifunctional diaminohydroxyphosphoribosylaminopyrimidine deaminase/5-amino-6-(5-phosphoribosylamino)uracil reductase RibD [Verrucomicrobiota bacterium]